VTVTGCLGLWGTITTELCTVLEYRCVEKSGHRNQFEDLYDFSRSGICFFEKMRTRRQISRPGSCFGRRHKLIESKILPANYTSRPGTMFPKAKYITSPNVANEGGRLRHHFWPELHGTIVLGDLEEGPLLTRLIAQPPIQPVISIFSAIVHFLKGIHAYLGRLFITDMLWIVIRMKLITKIS